MGPGQVDVKRLRPKGAAQNLGERGAGQPVEFAVSRTPCDLPAGNHNQNSIRGTVAQKPGNFLLHPFRRRRLGRSQEQQVLGFVQCAHNRVPQRRIRGETSLVAENPQRISLVPGTREALKRGLNGCRQVSVSRVTVGKKSVVTQALSPELPRCLPYSSASSSPRVPLFVPPCFDRANRVQDHEYLLRNPLLTRNRTPPGILASLPATFLGAEPVGSGNIARVHAG